MDRAVVGSKIHFPGDRKVFTVTSIRCGRKYYNIDMVDESGQIYKGRVRSLDDLTIVGKADSKSLINAQEAVSNMYGKRSEMQHAREERRNEAKKKLLKKGVMGVIEDDYVAYLFRERYSAPTNLKARIKFSNGMFDKLVTGITKQGVVIRGRKKAIPFEFVEEFVFEERKCPLTDPKHIEDAKKKGVLVGISNGEFYASSICASPSLRFISFYHYDSPSGEYYYDPEMKVYWRRAGSFD